MTKPALLIVSLVLSVGLYSVDAQGLGKCVDDLTADILKGVARCDAISEYAKCVLRDTGLYKSVTTEDGFRQFKTEFEAGLAKQGIVCDINVMRLVEELREEDRSGVTRATSPPKGYKDATTIGECINTLIAQPGSAGNCDILPPYLQCVFRVLNIDKLAAYLSEQDYQSMEQSIKNELSKRGMNCDINIRAVIQDAGRS